MKRQTLVEVLVKLKSKKVGSSEQGRNRQREKEKMGKKKEGQRWTRKGEKKQTEKGTGWS